MGAQFKVGDRAAMITEFHTISGTVTNRWPGFIKVRFDTSRRRVYASKPRHIQRHTWHWPSKLCKQQS